MNSGARSDHNLLISGGTSSMRWSISTTELASFVFEGKPPKKSVISSVMTSARWATM